jgi:hypothetical protein
MAPVALVLALLGVCTGTAAAENAKEVHARAATLKAAAGLKLEPAELTLSNDHLWRRSGASATVTLVGPHAAQFAALGAREKFVLHNADDNEVKLELRAFKPASRGVAEATLVLTSNPPAGRYTGEVTLFPFSPTAQRLKLTVNSHLPLWLAIVLVAIGVAFGVMGKALYALKTRRDVLLAAVEEVETRVGEVRTGLGEQVSDVADVTWYLDDLAIAGTLGSSQAAAAPLGVLSGVDALRNRIAEARNDKDLEEDTTAVLEVVARVQRWLRLAPAAWRLQLVREEGCEPRWRASRTWRDTRLLQEHLMYEPAVNEADDLAARVLWQIRWHHDLFALHTWMQSMVAAGAEGDVKLAAHRKLVEGLDSKQPEKSNVLTRTSAERDELELALEQLGEQLEAPSSGDLPVLRVPSSLSVNWLATPNLFTGWATVDGTSWLSVRRRAVGPPQRPTRRERSTPRRSRKDRRKDLLATVGWSLAPLLAASVVYAITVYNEAWGSMTDILTALAAGFVGKVVVDLATLPIFQSRRLLPAVTSAAAAASSAQKTPAAPAPAASSGASTKPTGG